MIPVKVEFMLGGKTQMWFGNVASVEEAVREIRIIHPDCEIIQAYLVIRQAGNENALRAMRKWKD